MGHNYSSRVYQQDWMVVPYSSTNTSKAVIKSEFYFTANDMIFIRLTSLINHYDGGGGAWFDESGLRAFNGLMSH